MIQTNGRGTRAKSGLTRFFDRHADSVALLIILFLVICFFWRQLFLHKAVVPFDILLNYSPWSARYSGHPTWNSIISDVARQFYPWKLFASQLQKAGIIPLWNPYVLSGIPFLHNSQAGILYPFQLVFLLFPVLHAYGYFIMIHLFLAGVFMYLFAKEIGVGRFGALIAALTFMFSQFLLHWAQHLCHLSVMIWIPLLFFFTERLVKRKSPIYSILIGLVIGSQLLGGMFQFSYYMLLSFGLYFVFRLGVLYYEERRFKSIAQILFLFGFSLVVGFSLSAIQLLPSLELSKYIVRTGEEYYPLARGAFPLHKLLTFLVPNFFGNPAHNLTWGGYWFLESGYVGILPLFLAILAFFSTQRKHAAFFYFLAILTLLLALGFPINKVLYYHLPFYDKFRSFGRWLYVYSFSLATLSGLGAGFLASAARGLDSSKRKRIRLLVVSFSLLMFLVVGSCFVFYLSSTPPIRYLLKQLAVFAFLTLSITIAIILLTHNFGQTKRLLAFLAFLLIFDLFFTNMNFFPALDTSLAYPPTESTNFLKGDKSLFRVARFGTEPMYSPLTPNTGMVYRVSDIQGSDVYILRRYADFMNLIENHGEFAQINEISNINAAKSLDSRLLDLVNVKYLLTSQEVNSEKWKLVLNRDIRIYQNRSVLPRAFLTPNYQVVKDDDELKSSLTDAKFDPSKTVLLEAEPKQQLDKSTRNRQEKVNIEEYSQNQIKINAQLPYSGFLVLADTYYPGWRVFVDGKEKKLFRADFAFRAVQLSSGKHQVVFAFDPPSYRVGLYVSCLTLLLIISMMVIWGGYALRKGLGPVEFR